MGKHAKRKASGGGVTPKEEATNKHVMNPANPVHAEAASKDDSFKRGGRAMSSGGVLSGAAKIRTATKGSADLEDLSKTG